MPGPVDANVAPIGHASDAAIESAALPPKVQALTSVVQNSLDTGDLSLMWGRAAVIFLACAG